MLSQITLIFVHAAVVIFGLFALHDLQSSLNVAECLSRKEKCVSERFFESLQQPEEESSGDEQFYDAVQLQEGREGEVLLVVVFLAGWYNHLLNGVSM